MYALFIFPLGCLLAMVANQALEVNRVVAAVVSYSITLLLAVVYSRVG